MRARLAFPLTALILLFLLQGLSAYFDVLFALASDAILEGRASAWAQMLLPLAALLAPAIPLARRLGRERHLALAAALTATARIALWFPAFEVRWIASAFVVAGGMAFLSAAVGCLDRRALAAGAAGAILLEQTLRFAGHGGDIILRPGVGLLTQIVLSAAGAAAAGYWLLAPGGSREQASLERRAGGLRLRGAFALACVLFLELTVLARADVLERSSGVSYELAALALIIVSAAAVVLHTRLQLPPRAHRPLMVGCALLAGAAAVFALRIGGGAAAVLLVIGHAAALALLARALMPGGGRRKGWTSTVAAFVLLGFVVLHGLTFLPVFAIPALQARGSDIHAAAAVLLVLTVLVLPRPAAIPRLHGRMPAALAIGVVVLSLAIALVRPTPRSAAARIDWHWVRGYDVRAARTPAGGGSDHRLVAAAPRLTRTGGESTTA